MAGEEHMSGDHNMNQKPVAWFHEEKYKTHFTTDPSDDMIGKYWQPLYTTPQSNNDFKPDWDTVKVYDEKFAEMLDEIQRLRAELKQANDRLHDVATLCANVEAQAAITQGVLKAVNTAAMKLTADLTCMEIDNDDRLDRDRVMERVMRWRNEWDKAMFEYRPKGHDPIVGTKTWFSEDGKIIQQELRQSDVYEREWVGLTDEEINKVMPYCHNEFDLNEFKEFAKAIEAKLREKNGYLS